MCIRTIILLIVVALSEAVSCRVLAKDATRFADSMKREVAHATTDTAKLRLLDELINNTDCNEKLALINEYSTIARHTNDSGLILVSMVYQGGFYLDCKADNTKAKEIFEAAIHMKPTRHNSDIVIWAYQGLAQAYFNANEKISALNVYRNALDANPNPTQSISVYGNMGQIYTDMGDYPHALDCYERAYSLQHQKIISSKQNGINDTVTQMGLLMTIADMRAEHSEADKALADYRQLLADCEHKNNGNIDIRKIKTTAIVGIGRCWYLKKNYDSALSFYKKALRSRESLTFLRNESAVLNETGIVYLEAGETDSAMHYALQSWSIAGGNAVNEAAQDAVQLPKTATTLAKIYAALNDYAKSLYYLNKAIAICKKTGARNDEKDAWQVMSDTYKAMHRPEEALTAYKNYIALRDSVFSQDKAKEITRIEMTGEFARKQMGDSLAQAKKDIAYTAELQRQKRDKLFFIAGGALMLIIAIGSVYFLVFTRRANRQIAMLMKEMHHRVKNNLQVISTLLNLQLADIVDESARKTIEEGITRISSIALIHHHLYRVDDLSSIEIAGFTKELLGQVAAIYSKPGQELKTKLEIPETQLDIDTAIPLGLILNELMTNSYKYAHTGRICPMDIALAHSGNSYTITYCDHGPGLTEGFSIADAESLGMRIINNLANQLGGDFHYRKADNSFVVNFKDTALRKVTA